MPITILIAERYAMIRDGLRALLDAQSDLRVVAEAENGREAVRLALKIPPDVAVLESKMPEMNGFDATSEIRDRVPNTAVVIVGASASVEQTFWAHRVGARGYLLKESSGEELVKAVRAVHAGAHYLAGNITDLSFEEYLRQHSAASPLERLSARERNILQLVVEGETSGDIAALLHLSRKTVETYRSRLMEKLDIHDLPGLVKFAIRNGLTPLE